MPTNNIDSYTFADYTLAWEYRERTYKQYKVALFYATLGFLAAGLLALYFGLTVFAVALLAIGTIFGLGSFHNDLMEDVIKEQYYMARLINQQTSDMAALRSELQERNSNF